MPFIKYFWWYFNSQPHKEADKLPPGNVHEVRTFQLTASQGGWPVSHFHSRCKTVFQLTASQGGWHFVVPVFLIVLLHFNSQPHKEADVSQHTRCFGIWTFQLTASQGGWRHRNVLSAYNFISTHSLTRRLTIFNIISWFIIRISTHSLTRRLTGLPELVRQIGYISTHSLTRRLTITSESQLQRIYISTHSLTRRLTYLPVLCWVWFFISTHSLTRRLTAYRHFIRISANYFNSQPHKEADKKLKFIW